jgi:hypothetical protein
VVELLLSVAALVYDASSHFDIPLSITTMLNCHLD